MNEYDRLKAEGETMPPLLEMGMEQGDISPSGRLPLNFNQETF